LPGGCHPTLSNSYEMGSHNLLLMREVRRGVETEIREKVVKLRQEVILMI